MKNNSNNKFEDFGKYLLNNVGIKKKAVGDYITGLRKLDTIIDGSLEPHNFIENDHYLDEIFIFLSASNIKPEYKRNIKTALYRFNDFAINNRPLSRQQKPSSFVNEWVGYNKVTAELKQKLNCTSNITGDFGELLIADVFGYKKHINSKKSIDLEDKKGKTYQVKTRKVYENRAPTSLGICRSLDFDFLISVLLLPNGKIFKVFRHHISDLNKIMPKKNGYQKGIVFVTNSKIAYLL